MVTRKLYAFTFALPILVFLFNEYLIYYLTIARCYWPKNDGRGATRAMIIADTHILGVFRGHWFDKLRREWQMHRSFQTAVTLLHPDAVFFLGDLMDEGLIGQDYIFRSYVNRFNELFETRSDVKRYVTMGNHDIGFHNEIFPQRILRFTDHFNVPHTVNQVELGGNIFVLLNSMAFEGDGCYLCASAVKELERLSHLLNCTQSFEPGRCQDKLRIPYSRPIVMQHFPLYRQSDTACNETEDMAPPNIRQQKFKPKHNCVSEASTRLIIDKLRPRLVFGGHVHYGCQKWWKAPDSFWEYTVSSFSWRNNHRPSFILASISPISIAVSTCFLPDEYVVIAVYVISICLWIGLVVIACSRRFARRWLSLVGWRQRHSQSKINIELVRTYCTIGDGCIKPGFGY